jgi:hypothetical protein
VPSVSEPLEEGRPGRQAGIDFYKTSTTCPGCLSKVCLFVLSSFFELINNNAVEKVRLDREKTTEFITRLLSLDRDREGRRTSPIILKGR